jgi:hypothetical protein
VSPVRYELGFYTPEDAILAAVLVCPFLSLTLQSNASLLSQWLATQVQPRSRSYDVAPCHGNNNAFISYTSAFMPLGPLPETLPPR